MVIFLGYEKTYSMILQILTFLSRVQPLTVFEYDVDDKHRFVSELVLRVDRVVFF